MFSEINEEICESKIANDRKNLYTQVIDFLYDNGLIIKKDTTYPVVLPKYIKCKNCAECYHHNDDYVCESNAIIEGIQKIFKGYVNYDSL